MRSYDDVDVSVELKSVGTGGFHFFFNDTATTEIYTLSLHDALPIWQKFLETMDFLFETYTGMVEPMQDLFRKRLPENDFTIEVERRGRPEKVEKSDLQNESERKAHRIAYNFTIRSAACDVIRCILPAATQANLGLVGNGRYFSGLISKLLSDDLKESNELAEAIRKALNHQIPTFIKRAEKNRSEEHTSELQSH